MMKLTLQSLLLSGTMACGESLVSENLENKTTYRDLENELKLIQKRCSEILIHCSQDDNDQRQKISVNIKESTDGPLKPVHMKTLTVVGERAYVINGIPETTSTIECNKPNEIFTTAALEISFDPNHQVTDVNLYCHPTDDIKEKMGLSFETPIFYRDIHSTWREDPYQLRIKTFEKFHKKGQNIDGSKDLFYVQKNNSLNIETSLEDKPVMELTQNIYQFPVMSRTGSQTITLDESVHDHYPKEKMFNPVNKLAQTIEHTVNKITNAPSINTALEKREEKWGQINFKNIRLRNPYSK